MLSAVLRPSKSERRIRPITGHIPKSHHLWPVLTF